MILIQKCFHRMKNKNLTASNPMSESCLTFESNSGSAAVVLPAYMLVQWRAVLTNMKWLFLYWLATTASCGSSGSAAASRACNESNTVLRVIAAAHWSLRISRQMAPVTLLIFGCQILVRNFTLGGLNGYVSGILISKLKVPPSYLCVTN